MSEVSLYLPHGGDNGAVLLIVWREDQRAQREQVRQPPVMVQGSGCGIPDLRFTLMWN